MKIYLTLKGSKRLRMILFTDQRERAGAKHHPQEFKVSQWREPPFVIPLTAKHSK